MGSREGDLSSGIPLVDGFTVPPSGKLFISLWYYSPKGALGGPCATRWDRREIVQIWVSFAKPHVAVRVVEGSID